MEPLDLNRPKGEGYTEQRDHGCASGLVEVVFRKHKPRLLRLFQEAREEGLVCLGAVAWLTDFEILDAMATLPCSVLVQKEDFLRPDSPTGAGAQRDGWRDILREHYEAVAGPATSPGSAATTFPIPWAACPCRVTRPSPESAALESGMPGALAVAGSSP